jgi:ABC-type uncharacterized transport system auxiliary subunit
MKILTNWIILGLSTLLLGGCGGKILYPKYYMLEMPTPPAAVTGNTRFAGALAVRRFESAPYIRQKRIVYRQVPEEIGFYEFHRWVSDPADMVTTAMIDSLRASHLFSSVKWYDGQEKQDYLMAGRLERLEETDYGGAVGVTAKLSAELINLHTGATDWTDNATETLKVDESSVNSVVIELSHAVQKSIDGLILSLDHKADTVSVNSPR